MKLFIFLLSLASTIQAEYQDEVFDLPIPTKAEFPEAVYQSGLFAWQFKISENSSETAVDIQGLEAMVQLAERRSCDMSIRVKVDGSQNVSFALSKCGVQSTTSAEVMAEQIFVVPPSYFTGISDKGSENCKQVKKSFMMVICGRANTTGTVDFHFYECPGIVEEMHKGSTDLYMFPILVVILLALAFGIPIPAFDRYNGYRALKTNNHQEVWTKSGKIKSFPGVQGTFA